MGQDNQPMPEVGDRVMLQYTGDPEIPKAMSTSMATVKEIKQIRVVVHEIEGYVTDEERRIRPEQIREIHRGGEVVWTRFGEDE